LEKPVFAWLLSLSRNQKRSMQIVADLLLMSLAFVVAMALRLESFEFLSNRDAWLCFTLGLFPAVVTFHLMGLYNSVIRYILLGTLKSVFVGILAAALTMSIARLVFSLQIPMSVPVIFALISFLLVGGIRFAMRTFLSKLPVEQRAKVLIYGAGVAGRQLKSSLDTSREYLPVAFIDDKAVLHGAIISGLRVHPRTEIRTLIRENGIERVLLAIPSARREARARILARLEPLPVRVQTIPAMADLVSGKARISEFREVAVEDLLGRDPVPAREELMHADIKGRVVLVTGAGGSIGAELCRQIVALAPRHLVMLDISEFSLYAIDQELSDLQRDSASPVNVTPLTGSVQSSARVAAILRRFGVETIYHAAAYKHVPMAELNVVEAVQNNVLGTLAVARAAIETGVRAFILVSTDKAVRPTSIMGASKRMAELVCQALAKEQSRTRFCIVRFGNVLGSSGSVIPRFRKQISAGGPVTVTHPEIIRYFMTIPEAAQLVIQAGGMARGGDVFVLDMGEPVKIIALAKQMIRLSGLTPVVANEPVPDLHDSDVIEIIFTGLRPGEKLYEELLIGDNATGTAHPRIMTATENALGWEQLEQLLQALEAACRAYDLPRLRRIMAEAPTAYRPDTLIADPFWNAGIEVTEGPRAVNEPTLAAVPPLSADGLKAVPH
jgi:FlaA1/EpsC-like NDP-sugar epimerase